MAWNSILDEREQLDLSPHQVKQAETQRRAADGAVVARIPEAFQWLLVPVQPNPQAGVEIQVMKLSGQEALASRASKKLRNDDLLAISLAGTMLRMEMDKVPLWRGSHASVKQLADDFARYVYLPRLASSVVLWRAIEDGLGLLTWETDTFAYADSFDEGSSATAAFEAANDLHYSPTMVGFWSNPTSQDSRSRRSNNQL